jgi:NAD(P)-dependent dehydrogenase (short-subunit alcohol dehydrogenase family)
MALEAFFKDRVYALSGGASGIGLEASKLLLKYGANISIGDIRFADDLLSTLGKELSDASKVEDRVLLKKIDVRSRDDVESWMSATVEKFGKLDGAANLAGTIPNDHNIGGVENIDDEQWRFVMDVNVYGIMNCCRAELKYIGKTVDGDKSGRDWSIVNAGSGLSLLGREFTDIYTTSKHAVLGLTRCIAKEVGKRGVRVNCIAP